MSKRHLPLPGVLRAGRSPLGGHELTTGWGTPDAAASVAALAG